LNIRTHTNSLASYSKFLCVHCVFSLDFKSSKKDLIFTRIGYLKINLFYMCGAAVCENSISA
jgi:hypothetical protein